jgi:hypothetical protein
MSAQIENELMGRVQEELNQTAPGFDPTIIPTFIELLMSLFTNCGGDPVTPEQAVEKVKKLSPFQQAMLRARLSNAAKRKKIKDARNLADKTADAVEKVAKASTPEERVAFATYIQNITSDDFNFDMI